MLQNNPTQLAMHKYMFDLLQEKYMANANIISRISHYLVTDADMREFSQLVGDLYESAYTRALKDYHVQLEAAGFKVAVSYNQGSNKGGF